MKITDHLEKASAFERALAKLNPLVDGELYTVFLMRAGTNRLNAALHALGITTDGAATAAKLGDLNHTYKPKLNSTVPPELKEAFMRLSYIEDLRPDYVRGSKTLNISTVSKAESAYAAIKHDTDAVLKQGSV
ncbi:MAG: hypothetical protein K2Y16_00325 [Burkholderiales bacterium]|nr:hypothetical protein [Burkholderiales bacterium]